MKNFGAIILALALLGPNAANASGKDEDGGAWHHGVGVTGELTSSDTWQLEASYHWFPVKYVGVGASVGLWRQIGYDGAPSANEWRTDEGDRSLMNGFFMPSLLLRTPAIIRTEVVDIGLMAEPGFMMNVPYSRVDIEETDGVGYTTGYDHVSCNRGRWYAFSLRTGVYASFDQIHLSAGYVYSDLDIYGMRRDMVYRGTRFDDFYPKRKRIGGAFLRISYSF